MGRKVNPIGFRIGVIRDWQAKWYADKSYADFLQEDMKLRRAIWSKYVESGISQIQIARQANEVTITINTSRPGVVIGRGGQRVDEMRTHLEKLIGKKIRLNILEIRQPELDAYLVARTIAEQIERRIAYRRAMKQAIFRTIQAGAKGIRVNCAGRLAGAEIARTQTMHEGRVPLHTLRADIDYGITEARTTLGRIGVKVWIYKGDIFPEPKIEEVSEVPAEAISEEVVGTVEPVEEVTEPVAEKVEEAAPSAEVEEKPKKATRKKKVTEAVVEKVEEAVPSAEVEEKPKKATRKKKVTEAVVEKVEEAAPSAEVEEKPKKATRKKKAADIEPAPAELEERNATT